MRVNCPASAMPITGHIQNGRATRATPQTEVDGVIRRAPKDFSGLDAALAEMRAAGVELLVIDGGDGTVKIAPTSTNTPPDGVTP